MEVSRKKSSLIFSNKQVGRKRPTVGKRSPYQFNQVYPIRDLRVYFLQQFFLTCSFRFICEYATQHAEAGSKLKVKNQILPEHAV